MLEESESQLQKLGATSGKTHTQAPQKAGEELKGTKRDWRAWQLVSNSIIAP